MRVGMIALALAISGSVHGQGSCSYLISAPSLGMKGINGGTTLSIVTDSGCPWSIAGLPAWLTVSGNSQGSGPAELTLEAATNPGGLRTAVLTVGGVLVPVRQFDQSVCRLGTGCALRPLPHVAFGGEWSTALFAVNPVKHVADWSIAFYSDTGSPLVLPMTGAGNLSSLTDVVPALGRTDYEANDASWPEQGGWGLITADISLTTHALFRRTTANDNYYEAAVPTQDAYSGFVVPFDATTVGATGTPVYTAFAVVNLNPSAPAHVVCTARDQSGVVIPNAVTIPALNPMGHWADFSFPALAGQRGTLDCTADTMVSAIALRAVGEAVSTLPVIINDP